MTEILAVIGGGSSLLLAIAFVTLTFLNRKDNRETLAARELAAGQNRQIDSLTGALAAKTEELRIEHNLRVDVEKQRDEAFEKGVTHAVERVRQANVVDANKILGEIVASMPARRSGVPKAVPRSEEPTSGDGLIKPDDL